MTDKYFDEYEEEHKLEYEPFFNSDNLEIETQKNYEPNSRQNTNNTDEKKCDRKPSLFKTFEEKNISESPNYLNNSKKIEEIKDNKNDDIGTIAIGRKRNTDNKCSDDNLRRKVKGLILDYLLEFINEKIRNLYNNNIGKGICILQFQKLNKKKLSSTNVKYNQEFLHTTLEEIFSETSDGISSFLKNHNSNLIKSLKNEIDDNKRNYFQNFFNLTFLQSVNHINGTEFHQELFGMKNLSDILDQYSNDRNYMKSLEFYFNNYELIINSKKCRRPKNEGKEDYLGNMK